MATLDIVMEMEQAETRNIMDSYIHVRQFLKALDLGQMDSQNIIPTGEQLRPLFYGGIGQYPKWCTPKNLGKECYSVHGIFMEWLTLKMIQNAYHELSIPMSIHDPYITQRLQSVSDNTNLLTEYADYCNPEVPWQDTILSTLNLALVAFFDKKPTITQQKINGDAAHRKLLDRIYAWLSDLASEQPIPPEPGQEYNCLKITGHPDLIWGDMVIDIKTSHNYMRMAPEAILQVLCYYTIIRIISEPEMHTYTMENPEMAHAIRQMIPAQNSHLTTTTLDALRGISKVGILLPLQRKLLTLDLREIDWNHQTFADILMFQRQDCLHMEPYYGLRPTVGNHFSRQPTLFATVRTYYAQHDTRRAVQFFTRGNQGFQKVVFSEQDYLDTYNFIMQHGVEVFIHSPYGINLSQPFNKWSLHKPAGKDGKSVGSLGTSWCVKLLLEELCIGHRIGSRGVVVHTGKCKSKEYNCTEAVAVKRMINSVVYILKQLYIHGYTTPLLLETPAGQGTEILTTFESMRDFYWSVICHTYQSNVNTKNMTGLHAILTEFSRHCTEGDSVTRHNGLKGNTIVDDFISKHLNMGTHEWSKLFKICIDTCHVWSAGEDPLIYMQRWIDEVGPESIGLVHLNECCVPKGYCRDLHHRFGFIGTERINRIIDLCETYHIPMVIE